MSTDEQMAAIGRLVTKHSATKKELTLLMGELREVGGILKTIGYHISKAEFDQVRQSLQGHTASKYLQVQEIALAISSVADLRTKLADSQSQLNELGI